MGPPPWLLRRKQGNTLEPSSYELAGESLAAVTGIFPKGPITPRQGAEAMALAERAGELIEKFCKFKKFDEFKLQKRVDDLEETFLKLSPLTELEIRETCAALMDPDVISSWAEAVNKGRAYLRAKWPAFIRQTPTGPVWIDPPRSVVNHISLSMAAVNDPLTMLEELNRGCMTPEVMDCVKETKPKIHERLLGAMSSQLQTVGAMGKKCPWSHEMQLRILFEQPPKGLVTFGVESEEKPQQSADFNIKFEGLQTRGQQL
jgi:hypothetical protein